MSIETKTVTIIKCDLCNEEIKNGYTYYEAKAFVRNTILVDSPLAASPVRHYHYWCVANAIPGKAPEYLTYNFTGNLKDMKLTFPYGA